MQIVSFLQIWRWRLTIVCWVIILHTFHFFCVVYVKISLLKQIIVVDYLLFWVSWLFVMIHYSLHSFLHIMYTFLSHTFLSHSPLSLVPFWYIQISMHLSWSQSSFHFFCCSLSVSEIKHRLHWDSSFTKHRYLLCSLHEDILCTFSYVHIINIPTWP